MTRSLNSKQPHHEMEKKNVKKQHTDRFVISFRQDYLRRQIQRTAAECAGLAAYWEQLSRAEVHQSQVTLRIQHLLDQRTGADWWNEEHSPTRTNQIFRLQVSVHHFLVVQILQDDDRVGQIEVGLRGGEPAQLTARQARRVQQREQVSAGNELLHEV